MSLSFTVGPSDGGRYPNASDLANGAEFVVGLSHGVDVDGVSMFASRVVDSAGVAGRIVRSFE